MRIYKLQTTPLAEFELQCELQRTLKPHATPVVVLAIDQTSTLLATGAADGVVKVWDIAGGFVTHTFRGPNVLVSALHFFELSRQVADRDDPRTNRKQKTRKDQSTSEADLNGPSTGFRLASGDQDGKVRIWDLVKRNCASVLDSHVSHIRAMEYSTAENTLLTASRDQTFMLWDARSWKVKRVVPVLEEIEVAGFVHGGKYVFTGGINGHIRIWDSEAGRELTTPQQSGLETDGIIDAIFLPTQSSLLTIRVDHTLTFYSTSSLADASSNTNIPALPEVRRISGTHDEIIDLAYLLPDRSLLALATNSEDVRIITTSDDASNKAQSLENQQNSSQAPKYFGADVARLKGHSDIIICLATSWSGHWLATGAKDNTAKLWRIDPSTSCFECFATYTGHAESIGAISLPQSPPPESSAAYQNPLDHPPAFLLTGSQDLTVKRWDVSRKSGKTPRALYTRKAHDKDINALDVSPNGQSFASASQDRLVKIWDVETGETIGILRGHRRGVWSVKFSPASTPALSGEDGVVASKSKGMILTGSGDRTVKIWSLGDYTCLRTLEGHTNSILKVCWIPYHPATNTSQPQSRRPLQVASAAGDGLVKIWNATTGDVATTLDNHEDRVWALTVHPTTGVIISGGGDSVVTFWKDTSSATAHAQTQKATELVEQEQKLQNYMRDGRWREGIVLALQLDHPGRLLALLKSVVEGPREADSIIGVKDVDTVLGELSDDQLFRLLCRVRDWNTNARTAAVAQRVLAVVFKSYSAQKLAALRGRKTGGTAEQGASMLNLIDALRAYTERHYKRVEELGDESWALEYTLGSMGEVGMIDE